MLCVRVCVCVCVFTYEGDVLVIGHLSLDAPPLGSQPLRRPHAAPPPGQVLPLDLVLVLHLQLRYPATSRFTVKDTCSLLSCELTRQHKHHVPADQVQVVLLRPLRSSAVFPVQVVQPFGPALLLWACADLIGDRRPGHAPCDRRPRRHARHLVHDLGQTPLLLLAPFTCLKENRNTSMFLQIHTETDQSEKPPGKAPTHLCCTCPSSGGSGLWQKTRCDPEPLRWSPSRSRVSASTWTRRTHVR